MKILVVSQYFYPENFRINELCLTLKERGHEVVVLTGKPNYPKGEVYEGYTIFGKEDEEWKGIKIMRVSLLPRKSGSVRLILNYISFIFFGSRRAKKLKNENFDIIYVFEVSPITVTYPAIALKKRTKLPIIINIQDLWPENIVAVTGIKNPLLLKAINKIVNSIYKQCDFILAASQSFVPKIQARVTNKEKVVFWPQYSIVQHKEVYEKKFNIEKFNIVFTGNIGAAQNLELVIEAADILRGHGICWNLVGDGRLKKQLIQEVNKKGLQEDIKFYDSVEERYVPDYLQSCDVALLILKPDAIFDMTIPAKLQTYMACGCAILGCVNGEAKNIITDSQAGMVCDEPSAKDLAKTALMMKDTKKESLIEYGVNAIKYNEIMFSKTNLINQLENIFKNNIKKEV